jgi:hypothetical protein
MITKTRDRSVPLKANAASGSAARILITGQDTTI